MLWTKAMFKRFKNNQLVVCFKDNDSIKLVEFLTELEKYGVTWNDNVSPNNVDQVDYILSYALSSKTSLCLSCGVFEKNVLGFCYLEYYQEEGCKIEMFTGCKKYDTKKYIPNLEEQYKDAQKNNDGILTRFDYGIIRITNLIKQKKRGLISKSEYDRYRNEIEKQLLFA